MEIRTPESRKFYQIILKIMSNFIPNETIKIDPKDPIVENYAE